MEYLTAAGRWGRIRAEDPLWMRHDRAGQAGGRLSSHGFVKNLKGYMREAGLERIIYHAKTPADFRQQVADFLTWSRQSVSGTALALLPSGPRSSTLRFASSQAKRLCLP